MGTFPPALTLEENVTEPAAYGGLGTLITELFLRIIRDAPSHTKSEEFVSFVGQLEVRTQSLNDAGCLDSNQLSFIEKRLNESLGLPGRLGIRKLETLEVYIAGLEATCGQGMGPGGGFVLGGTAALVVAGVAAGLWWWMGQQ